MKKIYKKSSLKLFTGLLVIIIVLLQIRCGNPTAPVAPIGKIPSRPSGLSPVYGATDIAIPAALSWNSVSDANSYHLQVASNNDFSSIVVEEKNIASASKDVAGLSAFTKYFWRVRSVNNAGNSGWSDYSSFTTAKAGTIPAPPTLIAPVSGATNISLAANLTWNGSFGATSYTLQVSTSSDFATKFFDQSGIINTSIQVSGLAASTKYYWRVNAAGNKGTSGWSDYFNFTTIATGTLPEIPALVSPANGVIVQTLSPTLIWSTSAGASTYQLQVSANNAFSTLAYEQTGLINTTQQTGGLNSGVLYYWRVKAINTYGTSAWSAVYTFTTPSADSIPSRPILSSPLNGATEQSTSPILLWNPSTRANSYSLQVSLNTSFTSLVYDQSNLTSISQQVSGLSLATTYYWRVSASNNGGTTGWSDYFSFTTSPLNGVPAAPTLLSPVYGAADISLTPTLSWSYSNGASSYTLQVSLNTNFTSLIYEKSGINGTNQQVTGLNSSATYYWRVNAVNGFGTSGWSNYHAFTTTSGGSGVPAKPTLLSPAYGALNQSVNPTLSWNSVTYAQTYNLQVSQSTSFSNLIVNQSGISATSSQVTGLLSGATYYWRVSAANGFGTSAWSDYFAFVTGSGSGSIPAISILSSPGNGATEQSTAPSLVWNQSSGAASYSLQVSLNDSFTSLLYNQSGLTSTSQQMSGLSNGTTYYWRVNATNSYGTSGWSNYFAFTTSTIGGIPYAPTLLSPAMGATDISLAPTLTWSYINGAASYQLQVSNNSSFSNLIYNQSGIKNTSQQVSGLNISTTYYWRVNSTNGFGTSGWSNYHTFTTTGTAVLQTPVLYAPPNEATQQPKTLNFSWSKDNAATSYTLQISTSSWFNNFFYDANVTGENVQISGLANSTTYFWRVKSNNATNSSMWSAVWKFTTSSSGSRIIDLKKNNN